MRSQQSLSSWIRRHGESICWITFTIDTEERWLKTIENHLDSFRNSSCCLSATLATSLNNARLAALMIVCSSAEELDKLRQTNVYIALMGKLDSEEVRISRLQNHSATSRWSGLHGRVTLAILDIKHNCAYSDDSMQIKHRVLNAFDAYISHGCQGVRRPPAPERLSVARSDGQSSTTYYCFFLWGMSSGLARRELTSDLSTIAHQAFAGAIVGNLPSASVLSMQRWHFDNDGNRSQSLSDSGDEQELDDRRLAGYLSEMPSIDPRDDLLRFNQFLATHEDFQARASNPVSLSSASTAANKVFALPEILSLILVHLPMKDLLLNQSVCRIWFATISSTVAIQEKLFFRPRGRASWRTRDGEFNPLLYERFPSFFTSGGAWTESLGPWTDAHWLRTARWYTRPGGSAYQKHYASWRRMIPCNPAPTEYQFVYYRTSWGLDSDWRLKSVTRDHTLSYARHFLTFGCLHDIVERIWHQRHFFPRANGFSVHYGSLSEAEGRIEDEDNVDPGWDKRELIRKVQNVFPELSFNVSGRVMVELRSSSSCTMFEIAPDFSRPDEFHQETSQGLTFAAELERW